MIPINWQIVILIYLLSFFILRWLLKRMKKDGLDLSFRNKDPEVVIDILSSIPILNTLGVFYIVLLDIKFFILLKFSRLYFRYIGWKAKKRLKASRAKIREKLTAVGFDAKLIDEIIIYKIEKNVIERH